MAILPNAQSVKKRLLSLHHSHGKRMVKAIFWFFFGAVLGFFFFVSFLFIFYKQTHVDRIYDGVMVNGVDFSGKKQDEVRNYFAQANTKLVTAQVSLATDHPIATISAKQISFGYDQDLLAQQAYLVGRSGHLLSDMSTILQAYTNNITLPAAYHYNESKLNQLIQPIKQSIDVQPVDALFNFENGRVTAFQLSSDGKAVDSNKLKQEILDTFKAASIAKKAVSPVVKIPVTTLKAAASSENANKLGIKELIASGTSLFQHSIESRAYNIGLAASRLNGLLIKPGEVFSFDNAVGDISALSGYKQAYVIENGKTVLGDGGGVCQVSTTLFRAALNAGLPIVERHPHAYRVGYYEQDSPPGIDAAIYTPNVDLKFKNDTGHYILIQAYTDMDQQRLTFDLYGTKDDREVTINKPVILSESPAPDPEYDDDPTLPKGEVKQVDFAAPGASVYFTRTVTKDGKVIIADKFSSNYTPWKAVYLRGTKE